MPQFGVESQAALASAHPTLQNLFNEVIKFVDCKVIEGERTHEQQVINVAKGVSWTLDSKHVHHPSLAVDVIMWPLDWQDWKRHYYFGGYVKATADRLGIRIRWGGDWDGDLNLVEEKRLDLVHFELL